MKNWIRTLVEKACKLEIITSTRGKQLGREFFWVILGQFIAAIGAIVGVRLLTGVMPPAIYGELSLGLTVATLAQQAILSPLAGSAMRFFAPAQEANQIRDFVHGVRWLFIQATIILLGLVVLFIVGLGLSGNSRWVGLAIASLAFALFSGYSAALDGMQNAMRQRAIVAWHAGLGMWLRFLIAVGLVSILGAFSQVAMIGYAFSSVLLLGSQFWFFRRRIFALYDLEPPTTLDQSHQWTKQMYAYAWPFATWGVFTWAQMASDRWALQIFTSTSQVGRYAVLYQLGYYPILLGTGLVIQLVQPVLFSRAGDGSNPIRMKHAYRLNYWLILGTFIITIVGVILAALLHRQVFALLTGPEYQSVSALLPWIILTGGLFTCGQMASLILMTGANSRALVMPKIVTAILGCGLNFIGAWWSGLFGVIIAELIFSLIYLIWMLGLAQGCNPPANQQVSTD